METNRLTVVQTDDYLHDDLEVFNRSAWKSGISWFLLKPVGKTLWFGPIIIPGSTACWQCLALRLRTNRRAEALVENLRGNPGSVSSPRGLLPVTRSLAYEIAALEILQWIVRDEPSRLENTLMTYDLANWKAEYHHVARLPQCSVCGTDDAIGAYGSTLSAAVSQEGIHRRQQPQGEFA